VGLQFCHRIHDHPPDAGETGPSSSSTGVGVPSLRASEALYCEVMASKEGQGPCVYTTPKGLCNGTFPLHPKEHYLPAGLGNFKHDIRLRNYICTNCQQNFSSLEDVFLHNSPEAFFRFVTGKKGRKSHRKKDIFYEPTAGMAPITVKGLLPGQSIPVLFQMTGIAESMQMKQVVFKDRNGDFHHLPYRPGHLARSFSGFMKDRKREDLEMVMFYCDGDEEENEIRSACGEFIKGKIGEPIMPVGGAIEGEMRAAITIPYLRAVAKIAFHFVLAHFHFTGFEPQFDGVKRFIYTGENHERFVQSIQEPFVLALQNPRAFLKKWCHLLSAQYDYNTMEARMQFFVGPVVKPVVWKVMLGPSPARVVGTYSKAFAYCYHDTPDKGGYAGEMTELQST